MATDTIKLNSTPLATCDLIHSFKINFNTNSDALSTAAYHSLWALHKLLDVCICLCVSAGAIQAVTLWPVWLLLYFIGWESIQWDCIPWNNLFIISLFAVGKKHHMRHSIPQHTHTNTHASPHIHKHKRALTRRT